MQERSEGASPFYHSLREVRQAAGARNARVGALRLRTPRTSRLRASHRRKLGRAVPWPLLSLAGFGVLILAGAALLALPISTESGNRTSSIDALFTAVSAVTVTGLVVVDTADHWNQFGEGVIMGLIQLGGLGIMTSVTFLMVLVGFRIGLRGRALAREDLAVSGLASVRRFVISIAAFTFVVEGIGFTLFLLRLIRANSLAESAWQAAFQAVSAFNNAGFDIQGGFRSITGYSGDYYFVLVTAGLVILGGISFAVVANILSARKLRMLSLNSKIVLSATLLLLVVGMVFVLVVERDNPETLGQMSWGHKALNAFFQSVTSRTSGFNTFPTSGMHDSTLFLTIVLMFIGGASGSTSGGIKVNTFAVVAAAVMSSIRGRKGNEAFGRRIPDEQLRKALAVAFLALIFVVIATLVFVEIEEPRFIYSLFMVLSAFATVGLSTIDTSMLSESGKIHLMAVMFIGKLGIPLLGLLLARLDRQPHFDYPEERVNLA